MKRSFLLAFSALVFLSAGNIYAATMLPFPSTPPYNAPSTNSVLLYGPSLASMTNSEEQQAALADGYDVVVATGAQWSLMTATSAFATYRALVFGDLFCNTSPALLANAVSNNAIWSAAVAGNIIVIGTDPTVHASLGGRNLMRRGICFAVGGGSQTGLYVSLSCYYVSSTTGTTIPLLAPFGTFTVHGNVAYNNAHIVSTGPCLTGLACPGPPLPLLDDTVLSNWTSSVHEGFDTWPPSFDVFALARSLTTVYTATDGTQGLPYILTRGTAPITSISLGPPSATNPIGTTHTVTATITPAPPAGTPVTFKVISGPNAVLTLGPFPTNALGVASATYTGSGGVGLDFIVATYPHGGATETSNTVRKNWVETAACAVVHAATLVCDPTHPGTITTTLAVTNQTGGPVTTILLTPPAGSTYTLSQQVFTIPPLANGASTTIPVSITGAPPMGTVCLTATLMNLTPATAGQPCDRCCCSVRVCFTIPDCSCAIITSQTLTPVTGMPGSYTYSFTVLNQSGYTIQHLYVHAPPGATAVPSHIAVSIAPGSSYSGTVTFSGVSGPNFCIYITLHDAALSKCCTIQRCFGDIQ